MKIAKLSKVELREVWPHEAHDFTKWLAEPENLELLSDEIGIGLDLVQVEANVGRYNVDILAREENTSKKVIIENQLETTNHSHLGQLITYAAGLEAEYIIWLMREARACFRNHFQRSQSMIAANWTKPRKQASVFS